MDLWAYMQIEELEGVAKDNNIDVPRLRGYRLMKDEEPMPQEEINKMKKDCEIEVIKDLCEAEPFWNPNCSCFEFSYRTDCLKDFYLVKGKKEDGCINYISVRWDRIHGWKRKIAKFQIKKQRQKIQNQYKIWNKYVGRKDVLYIHSRMGGSNWKNFEGKTELMKQSWFLDRVDDCFDDTYCDFYAKLNKCNMNL